LQLRDLQFEFSGECGSARNGTPPIGNSRVVCDGELREPVSPLSPIILRLG
jgi:hypothetical protein